MRIHFKVLPHHPYEPHQWKVSTLPIDIIHYLYDSNITMSPADNALELCVQNIVS